MSRSNVHPDTPSHPAGHTPGTIRMASRMCIQQHHTLRPRKKPAGSRAVHGTCMAYARTTSKHEQQQLHAVPGPLVPQVLHTDEVALLKAHTALTAYRHVVFCATVRASTRVMRPAPTAALSVEDLCPRTQQRHPTRVAGGLPRHVQRLLKRPSNISSWIHRAPSAH